MMNLVVDRMPFLYPQHRYGLIIPRLTEIVKGFARKSQTGRRHIFYKDMPRKSVPSRERLVCCKSRPDSSGRYHFVLTTIP